MEANILTAVIITLAFLYLLNKVRRSHSGKSKLIDAIKDCRKLSKQSAIGSYVKFTGDVTHPTLESLVENQSCSWWQTNVNAVFKSKEKKPKRGMVTHKPKVFEASSDDQPLMLQNDEHLVMALFEKLSKVIVNPLSNNKKSNSAPLPEIDVKPKYQHYEVNEYWLPTSVQVTLLGTVIGNDNNLVTISGNKKDQRPALLFIGDEQALLDIYQSRVGKAKGIMLSIVTSVIALNGAMFYLDDIDLIVYILIAAGIFMLFRSLSRRSQL